MSDSQLERIEKKVDSLDTRVDDVLITLERQHGILAEHQRRSLANEANIEHLRTEVKPIATHVAVVGAITKAIAFVGTLVGIMAGIGKLLGVLE